MRISKHILHKHKVNLEISPLCSKDVRISGGIHNYIKHMILCTCVMMLYSVYHLPWYILVVENDMASVHTRHVLNFTCVRLHRTTVKPSNTLVAGLTSIV